MKVHWLPVDTDNLNIPVVVNIKKNNCLSLKNWSSSSSSTTTYRCTCHRAASTFKLLKFACSHLLSSGFPFTSVRCYGTLLAVVEPPRRGGIRRGHPLPLLLIDHLSWSIHRLGASPYCCCGRRRDGIRREHPLPIFIVTTATLGRIFNSSVPSLHKPTNSTIAIRPSFPVTSFSSFVLPSFELRVGSIVDLQVGPRPTKVLYAWTLGSVVVFWSDRSTPVSFWFWLD